MITIMILITILISMNGFNFDNDYNNCSFSMENELKYDVPRSVTFSFLFLLTTDGGGSRRSPPLGNHLFVFRLRGVHASLRNGFIFVRNPNIRFFKFCLHRKSRNVCKHDKYIFVGVNMKTRRVRFKKKNDFQERFVCVCV